MREILFIVDVDNTLWDSNVIVKTIYRMYEKGLFEKFDPSYDDLQEIVMRIYFNRRKYIDENKNKSFYPVIEKTFSEYLDDGKYFAEKYFETFDEVKREIELFGDVENFLKSLRNYGKLIVWTDGHYDNTIKLLRKLIPSYDDIFDEELYPEKLYRMGFKDPFKPNQDVMKMIVEKYNPDITFAVGDHPYYDGFLAKAINGKSIIIYKKSKDIIDLLSDYSMSVMVQLYYKDIVELYLNGKVMIVNSFDEIIELVDRYDKKENFVCR